MALPIRPIPDVTGEDAVRFIEAAEAAERNPGTIKLPFSSEEVRQFMNLSKLY